MATIGDLLALRMTRLGRSIAAWALAWRDEAWDAREILPLIHDGVARRFLEAVLDAYPDEEPIDLAGDDAAQIALWLADIDTSKATSIHDLIKELRRTAVAIEVVRQLAQEVDNGRHERILSTGA